MIIEEMRDFQSAGALVSKCDITGTHLVRVYYEGQERWSGARAAWIPVSFAA